MAKGVTYYAVETASGEVLDELNLTSFRYSEVLSTASGFEATIPVRSPKATRANLEPWANAIYVDVAGVLLYGGPVTIPKAALGKGHVDIGGKGLLGAYADGRRTVRSRTGMAFATGDLASDVRWAAGTDLFRVVEDLFDHAATFAGDLGIVRNYRGAAPGLLGAGLEDDLAFATYERRGIYELLTELAHGDPGFDFGVSHEWDTTGTNGRPVSTLTLDPVRGRRTGLVFEAGKNITVLDYELNGEGQANALDGFGAGEGDSMVRTSVVDVEAIYPTGRYPRLEGGLTDKRAASTNLLLAKLRGALSRTVGPAEVVTVELIDTADVPLGSFIALEGSWRVVAYDVGFDTDGLPKITANLTPETAYGDLFAGI